MGTGEDVPVQAHLLVADGALPVSPEHVSVNRERSGTDSVSPTPPPTLNEEM